MLKVILCLCSVTVFVMQEKAEANPKKAGRVNLGPPAPITTDLELLTDEGIQKLKLKKSIGRSVATADQVSPELDAFVKALITVQTGDAFHALISKYDNDEEYKKAPLDLQYVIARLATWLPFEGIGWRLIPMVHKVLPVQQMILTTMFNYFEQVKINFKDSHVEAQLLYLTVPTANILQKRISNESEFVSFLAGDVHRSIVKSIARLEKILESDNKNIVYDTKIRFGEAAFPEDKANQLNNDYDRYKMVGNAEIMATIARLYRRLYNISVVSAYNWNGHLALRGEISRLFGLGVVESSLWDQFSDSDEGKFIRGVTREQRTNKVKAYKDLYKLTQNGKEWMQNAYFYLHKSVLYSRRTWDAIKSQDKNAVFQLDPEIFLAREDQVEMGLSNLEKLTQACNAKPSVNKCEPSANGATSITAAFSRDELAVNFKAFFDSPPADLKDLYPTKFAGHEDLMGIKTVPFDTLKVKKNDLVSVKIKGKETLFRNYYFGRAKEWNHGESGYGRLFPGLGNGAEVANAMRILNESRGTRIITNGLTLFVR